jgi:hypothetical protein
MRKQWPLAAITLLSLGSCSEDSVETRPHIYVSFPLSIDPRCRDRKATMFDECGDQSALFATALARAKSEGKVLLVEYGAEWCIWCHVFDAHINGDRDRFRYTYGRPEEPEALDTRTFNEGEKSDPAAADALRDFVATHFVVVHVDAEYAPGGDTVLEATGADEYYAGGIPFVFTVDAKGHIAGRFDHDSVEKRREGGSDWYRGYDRAGLLRQLTEMHDTARAR